MSNELADHSVPRAVWFDRAIFLVSDGHDAVAETDGVGNLFSQVGAVTLVLVVQGRQRRGVIRVTGL